MCSVYILIVLTDLLTREKKTTTERIDILLLTATGKVSVYVCMCVCVCVYLQACAQTVIKSGL